VDDEETEDDVVEGVRGLIGADGVVGMIGPFKRRILVPPEFPPRKEILFEPLFGGSVVDSGKGDGGAGGEGGGIPRSLADIAEDVK
jgi:hypothetical protein